MNLKSEVVKWPSRYRKIPKPYYVVRTDDHFMVCTLDSDFNLIDEVSAIHWNPYVIRRWALEFSKSYVAAKRSSDKELAEANKFCRMIKKLYPEQNPVVE